MVEAAARLGNTSSMLRVLIAVDETPAAEQAVRFAARLFKPASDAQITVLYVRPLPAAPVVAGPAPPIARSNLEREVQQAERELLEEAAATLRSAGLQVETRLETGQPAEEIGRVANEGDYDLVVLGSHGHGAVRELIVGTVSAAVVGLVQRPVLLVPEGSGA